MHNFFLKKFEKGIDIYTGIWYIVCVGRKSRSDLENRIDPRKTAGKEEIDIKTVTIEKHAKWWYVIVREEGSSENLSMAGFTTRRVAIECRDNWARQWGLKVV